MPSLLKEMPHIGISCFGIQNDRRRWDGVSMVYNYIFEVLSYFQFTALILIFNMKAPERV